VAAGSIRDGSGTPSSWPFSAKPFSNSSHTTNVPRRVVNTKPPAEAIKKVAEAAMLNDPIGSARNHGCAALTKRTKEPKHISPGTYGASKPYSPRRRVKPQRMTRNPGPMHPIWRPRSVARRCLNRWAAAGHPRWEARATSERELRRWLVRMEGLVCGSGFGPVAWLPRRGCGRPVQSMQRTRRITWQTANWPRRPPAAEFGLSEGYGLSSASLWSQNSAS
jgi:hypothetical protein